MNKSELVGNIVARTGLTKKDVTTALEATLETITEVLASGEPVKLVNFANFSVVPTAERNGANPSTGEKIVIKAGKRVKFKASDKLKEIVNV